MKVVLRVRRLWKYVEDYSRNTSKSKIVDVEHQSNDSAKKLDEINEKEPRCTISTGIYIEFNK